MAQRVVHFEIEAKDRERVKKFYAAAFGWKMEQYGEDMGNYTVVKTGENTGKMEDMGIDGGIYEQVGDKKEVNAYRCVISVDDIEKAMADVKAAGGTVTGTPRPIPGVGLFVSCLDTEENHFTLLQPSMDDQK